MTASTMILVALVLVPVVALLAFAGCTPFSAATDTTPPPVTPPTPKYQDVILAEPGLVGYWRLSEPAGATVAIDSSSAAIPGGYSIGANPGQPGALRQGNDPLDLATGFDGVQGRVTVPFALSHNAPLQFTVEAWVKPTMTGPTTGVVVASIEANPQRGFSLAVVRQAGKVVVRQRIADGANNSTTLDVDLGPASPGGWWHLVATYTRSGSGPTLNSKLILYTNGKRLAELPTPAKPKQIDYRSIPFGSTTPLLIGAQPKATGGAVQDFFTGEMDEVALYNVALDDGKVLNHYAAASKP